MTMAVDPMIKLGFPIEKPEPPKDCKVCRALVAQRETAVELGDLAKVTDCNVEIRNHHRPPRLLAAQ
ncbi:hypothetical protein [Streptomyces canus]|uniref:hypothetical protein n=1 Tax=Streptomyces canus TaxID=58343 RepID=UPI00386EA819|nr:hypothetical protein OH824_18040 [Streptomyces canus]